jgi:cytochrome c
LSFGGAREAGLTGPSPSGVVGRAIASARGFRCSDALQALPRQGYGRWTEAVLDAFITPPEDRAPGTAMTFAGIALSRRMPT